MNVDPLYDTCQRVHTDVTKRASTKLYRMFGSGPDLKCMSKIRWFLSSRTRDPKTAYSRVVFGRYHDLSVNIFGQKCIVTSAKGSCFQMRIWICSNLLNFHWQACYNISLTACMTRGAERHQIATAPRCYVQFWLKIPKIVWWPDWGSSNDLWGRFAAGKEGKTEEEVRKERMAGEGQGVKRERDFLYHFWG